MIRFKYTLQTHPQNWAFQRLFTTETISLLKGILDKHYINLFWLFYKPISTFSVDSSELFPCFVVNSIFPPSYESTPLANIMTVIINYIFVKVHSEIYTANAKIVTLIWKKIRFRNTGIWFQLLEHLRNVFSSIACVKTMFYARVPHSYWASNNPTVSFSC